MPPPLSRGIYRSDRCTSVRDSRRGDCLLAHKATRIGARAACSVWAGLNSRAATKTLEIRDSEAVKEAREARATLLEARKHEAIGWLTGGIAHDFNSLLQTISTWHHVLERSIGEGTQRRVLDSVMRAPSKAADLIKQMLALWSRAKPAPCAIDLADLLLKSQELLQKAVGERIGPTAHCRGSADVVCRPGPTRTGDPEHCLQLTRCHA